MARETTRPTERERALRETRQRLTLLEIETHRIKAELARLESEIEIDLADELAGELHAVATNGHKAGSRSSFSSTSAPLVTERSASPMHTARVDLAPRAKPILRSTMAPGVNVVAKNASQAPKQRRKRRSAPAWVLSLAVHAAVLALLAPLGFVILTNDDLPLFASMFDVEESNFDPGVVPVEMVAAEEEFDVQEAIYSEPSLPLAESLAEDFSPLPTEEAAETAAMPGLLSALPTDVGTLMAGGGSEKSAGRGRGRAGRNELAGELGRTSFFGTPAKANRVVFLVDNSGSMKQGRMETTLFELARSIDAMSDKQEFYVVFYSNQAYPMFYPTSVMEPLAATKENKQRLYAWLQTVELCQGGALLKAMEIAESLDPQVVYVLSDGDITGAVTMQRLTQTNDRPFAVHTLGMGVSKPQDAQNLLAIAQANRGTFQMVRPLPAAVQSAKTRPIRSNGRGVSWGEGGP